MLVKFAFIGAFLQQVAIEKKLKSAPDNNYAIGLFIGELLPFVFLIALAYLFFYQAKKRIQKNR